MFWILAFYNNIFVYLCESANLAGVTQLLKGKYKDANTQWLSKNLQKCSKKISLCLKLKGYFLRTAHQKHDGTLVNFKGFCLNELAELTWAGLFEAVWRWPRVSAKFELGYQGSKSKFSLILFAYNLMIGYSKKNRENFPRECFW